MARTNNLTNFLNDVATAIKTKLGDSTAIPAAQFDSKIMDITTGGSYQTKSITIQTNGNYTLNPDSGYDAMDQVTISVTVTDPEYATNLALSQQILGSSALPYIPLEYIESTGTQYINTEISLWETADWEIYLDFMNTCTNTTYGTYSSLFSLSGGANTNETWINNYGRSVDIRFNGNKTNSVFIASKDTRIALNHKCINNVVSTLVDGVVKNTKNISTIGSTENLYFGYKGVSYFIGRIYSLKLFKDNLLVRDFIPVKRISNNVICLYDKVTNQFFTNQGTGNFIAGPEIN